MNNEKDFFLSYILAALRCSWQAVRQTDEPLSDVEREQAWHLLSYALNFDREEDEGIDKNGAIVAVWQAGCELILALAPKMEQAGFRGDWLVYLKQAECCAKTFGDQRAAAEIKLHIGHLYRLTSQFEAARAVLRESHALFTYLADAHGQIRALNHLAYAEWQAHRYAQANQLAEQTIVLCEGEASEIKKERATSLSVLGLVAGDRLQWQDAERYHRRALSIRSELGLLRESAFSLQNLGLALCKQMKFDEGIACYEQALPILDDLNDRYHAAIIQMNLGLAYHDQCNYPKAIALSQQAEVGFRLHQSQHYAATISKNLAVSYMALQEWRQAEHYFQQSIEQYTELGYKMWRLLTTDGLAESYLRQQRYVEASALLESVESQLPKMIDEVYYDYLCKAIKDHLQEARMMG